MSHYPRPGPPHQSPPPSGISGVLLPLVTILGGIAIVGVLLVLALFGVRKYLASAKTSESKNALGQMARDAATQYEERQRLCASASAPIPRYVPHHTKYQSTAADWVADMDADAGFACLKFEINSLQAYQNDYRATATDFRAIARGDVDGDGKESYFEARGSVVDGQLTVAPTILEKDPDE